MALLVLKQRENGRCTVGLRRAVVQPGEHELGVFPTFVHRNMQFQAVARLRWPEGEFASSMPSKGESPYRAHKSATRMK